MSPLAKDVSSFEDWADVYLKLAISDYISADYGLYNTIQGCAFFHGVDLRDKDWHSLQYLVLQTGTDKLPLNDLTINKFQLPLRELYDKDCGSIDEDIPCFARWANSYLSRFWRLVVIPGRMNDGIKDQDLWDEMLAAFAECHSEDALRDGVSGLDFLKSQPSIGNPQFYFFIGPLSKLYDRKFSLEKISTDSRFQSWANHYLKVFFREVVLNVDDAILCNKFLWNELIDAAIKTDARPGIFSNFLEWQEIHEDDLVITNCELNDFVRPLSLIFRKNERDILNNMSAVDDIVLCDYNSNDAHEPNDLFDAPEEELNVIMHPVALPSKIEADEFKREVFRVLTHCLKQCYRWISNDHLAMCFGVDQRQFEAWASKNLVLRSSTGSGVSYWGLPFVDFVDYDEGKTMTDKTIADETTNAPSVGSEDFDRLLTQFLFSSEKPWRNGANIAKALNCDQKVLEKHLLNNPTIASRPGKGTNCRYFSLLSRQQSTTNGDTTVEKKDNTIDDTTNTTNVIEDKKKHKKNPQSEVKLSRPSFKPEELMAFSMLYSNCDQFVRTMHFYANRLAAHHKEAFAQLTQAEKAFEAGVALLKNDFKIQDRQLPASDNL